MSRQINRRLVTFAMLIAASAGCLSLLYGRRLFGGGGGLDLLAWNLLLAWVPFLLALVLYDGQRRGRGAIQMLVVGAVWLLFLPNSPYIITDFVHAGESLDVPTWYDAATIASFAGLGLALGFGSLFLVQSVVRARLGSALAWCVVIGSLALCSAGMYIGRVVRLNSWDIVANPAVVVRTIIDPFTDPGEHADAFAALAGLTGALLVAYLVAYTLSMITPAVDDDLRGLRRNG